MPQWSGVSGLWYFAKPERGWYFKVRVLFFYQCFWYEKRMVNKSLPTMGCAGNVKLLCYSTFRKAMRYRLEVRNSREVKFALEVFSSLNSNNFVRFFKLLKSASYLNACIIHRYFTQVRRSALRVMTRAYTPNSPYPLRVLQDLLAFEDKHEVRMTFFFIILSWWFLGFVWSPIFECPSTLKRETRSE